MPQANIQQWFTHAESNIQEKLPHKAGVSLTATRATAGAGPDRTHPAPRPNKIAAAKGPLVAPAKRAPRAGAVTSWPQLREHGSPPIIRGRLHSCPASPSVHHDVQKPTPHTTRDNRLFDARTACPFVLAFLIPTSFFSRYALSNSQW